MQNRVKNRTLSEKKRNPTALQDTVPTEHAIGLNSDRNRNKFINQIRAPGGHMQITIMIDTQQQYIKLNIYTVKYQ